MELLETQDPEKKRLIESSDRHKRAMEKEVDDLTKTTDRMLMNALIIGGSLALTYLLISSIARRKKKKKKKLALAASASSENPTAPEAQEEEEDDEPSVFNKIGNRILQQATMMLLDIAKDKLMEYLESRKKADDHS